MFFKVSDDYKGSFVLSSIGVTLKAGKKVHIEGRKILSPDVKMAIKNGILSPLDENDEYVNKYSCKKSEALVMNKTDKILSIGDTVLKPFASLLISKDLVDSKFFKTAESKGYISIISDDDLKEDSTENNEKVNIKTSIKKGKIVDGEKMETKPVVWDFDKQKLKDAEVIEVTAKDIKTVGEEDNKTAENETLFVDEENKKDNEIPISKDEEKIKINRKKKDSASKKDNEKKIKPVGEEKQIIGNADEDLDSRGNPNKKASDALRHFIAEIEQADIDFVDKIDNDKDNDFFIDD